MIRHMGEVASVLALINQTTDADIMRLTSVEDRNRSALIGGTFSMPAGDDVWRHTTIGQRLEAPAQIVRANFFQIDSRHITPEVVKYVVVVNRIASDGSVSAINCSLDMDGRSLAAMFQEIRRNHPEWSSYTVAGQVLPIGVAYDGRENLYASRPLPLTTVDLHGAPYHEERVYVKNAETADSGRYYLVSLTYNGSMRF
jgi:hypothetical protein